MDPIAGDAIDEVEAEDTGDESTQANGTANTGRFGTVTDDELKTILKDLQANITVVGCGSASGNTVNRVYEEEIKGAKFVATNTDVQHLVEIGAGTKILMGGQKTQGHGAGSSPRVGEEAALKSQEKIYDATEGSDMVPITAGLGGGIGTGSASVVAKTACESGVLTIAIATTPSTAEDKVRRANAEASLERLRGVSDTVIVVPNDRLLDTVGRLLVRQASKVSDEVLMRSVKGITGLITKPGLVNLDLADVKTVTERGGVTMIGFSEPDSYLLYASPSPRDS